MVISIEKFMAALPYMGWGMLGIFVTTAVIVAAVYILNALFKKKN